MHVRGVVESPVVLPSPDWACCHDVPLSVVFSEVSP